MKSTAVIFLCGLFCVSLLHGQHADRLKSLYQEGKLTETITEGQQICAEYPFDILANYYTGRAMVDDKQFSAAIPYLKRATTNEAPRSMAAWAHGYLGISYYISDDILSAQRELRRVLALKATPNSVQFAEKYLRLFQLSNEYNDWRIVEMEYIRFHVQPDHGISDLLDYCGQRLDAYKKINAFFEADLPKKIDFYVWSNPAQGRESLERNVGFANSNLCIINARVQQSKGHEITHILCDYGLGVAAKNRLINEGVAVLFDQTKRDRISLAKTVLPADFSLEKMFRSPDEYEEDILYPIGGAFIEYLLNEGGEELLKELLRDQRWNNLLDLYGWDIVDDFESLLTS